MLSCARCLPDVVKLSGASRILQLAALLLDYVDLGQDTDVTIKPGQGLVSLGIQNSGQVVAHPAQRATFGRIIDLITGLRACREPRDFYEFQRVLFGAIYGVEERRAQCSRMIKRLGRGEGAPKDAPPPPHYGDVAKLESWQLEAYVYERLARQLRTVGDGLAWRCFGYDRHVILTVSRNHSAGPMFGKAGLPYELGRIQELWERNGHFALHHDLTNCLRIADLTEFTDRGMLLREIKAKPHAEKAQMDRAQAAVDALMHGGELPGRPGARLVQRPRYSALSGAGTDRSVTVSHSYFDLKNLGGGP
jgi:hypothetical protein